jgi:hypothetical protein
MVNNQPNEWQLAALAEEAERYAVERKEALDRVEKRLLKVHVRRIKQIMRNETSVPGAKPVIPPVAPKKYRQHTPEHRAAISAALAGKRKSLDHRRAIAVSITGHEHSLETKEKLSLAMKEQWQNDRLPWKMAQDNRDAEAAERYDASQKQVAKDSDEV